MIKTKFVFAVSLVAMLAVGSAWADTPGKNESVDAAHTVYTDQSPTSTEGVDGSTAIAGVTYVNRAVNKAGASATAAEAHAAAAGASALAAQKSAEDAAESAKKANEALADKADKSALADYATVEYVGGQLSSVSTTTGTLNSSVEQLQGDLGDLSDTVDGKQAKSTADYQMGNKSGGWTTMTTKQKNALDSGVTSTTKVTRPASTAVGTTSRPVYVTSAGVATAVTGMSIPYGMESEPTSWATIWVE